MSERVTRRCDGLHSTRAVSPCARECLTPQRSGVLDYTAKCLVLVRQSDL